jgi:hypothetical protein
MAALRAKMKIRILTAEYVVKKILQNTYGVYVKRFLINIALFAIVAALLSAAVIGVTLAIARTASFKLPEDKTIVVVGASKVCDGFDDEIFSRAVNVSLETMPYFIECAIARRFIEQNAHLDKVILEFDADYMDLAGDFATIGELTTYKSRYFSLLNKDVFHDLLKNNDFPSAFISIPFKHARTLFSFFTGHKLTYKDLYLGGQIKREGSHLPDESELIEKSASPQIETPYQMKYILSLADLCKQNNVELILIDMPLYNGKNSADRTILDYVYNSYFSDIKYLNFNDFDLPADLYFDEVHLNAKGAVIFSEYLESHYEEIFGIKRAVHVL